MSNQEPERIKTMTQGSRLSLGIRVDPFAPGDRADWIFIVERGAIRFTPPMQVQEKDEDVRVEERRPGPTVGWSALIPPHYFTLKATAPLESDLFAFARKNLFRLFELQPKIGHRLQLFQAMWLRNATHY